MRKAAYYSRNGSYSRSAGAEEAEAQGRLPRLRAAKAMGLSVAAFDAGCAAVEYHPTEYHHVGKYAREIIYFDVEALRDNRKFFAAAAATYKSKNKREEVAGRPRRAAIDAFRRKLIRQRDCSRPVRRHSSRDAWNVRGLRAGIGFSAFSKLALGDIDGLKALMGDRQMRIAEAAAVTAALCDYLRRAGFAEIEPGRRFARQYSRINCVFVHGANCVNVYGAGKNNNLSAATAMQMVRDVLARELPSAGGC